MAMGSGDECMNSTPRQKCTLDCGFTITDRSTGRSPDADLRFISQSEIPVAGPSEIGTRSQVGESPEAFVLFGCACGCEKKLSIPSRLLETRFEPRVKKNARPACYCKSYGEFVVSGSTGFIYSSLACLNFMNE
jgi:hypothetical protein